MTAPKEHKIVAIPLNRESVISYLKTPSAIPRGAEIRVLGQRPSEGAEIEWAERLRENPSVEELLWRDLPINYLTDTTTDRLIPVEYILNDKSYLTRNLGGWSPVYFGLVEADKTCWETDPLLSEAEVLASYGEEIKYFSADANLVESRLDKEFGTPDINTISRAVIRLQHWRVSRYYVRSAIDMMNYADQLYTELVTGGELSERDGEYPAIPHVLLIDELLGQLVRIELARRELVAGKNMDAAKKISDWQKVYSNNHGLSLILKGEYVMGRQRRSTVMISEAMGIVAKQPGNEPFHEAELGAKSHRGTPENRPVLTRNGEIVTPCGRIRLIIEQELIIRLNHIFGHNIKCISALGFIIEPFISGPTLQEYLLEDPSRLTQELYSYILLHQLICEELGVENGDWHSANFIVIAKEESLFMEDVPNMVHIDWGAARPLEDNELSGSLTQNRLDQVENIAFSFHNEALASAVKEIHATVTGNKMHLANLRNLAANIVNQKS